MWSKRRKYTEACLRESIVNSYSYAGVLRNLGLVIAGGNYGTLKKDIRVLNIDISHFTGQGHLKGKTHSYNPPKPLTELLVEHSHTKSWGLKNRLIKEGYFEHKCYKCGRRKWLEEPIPIELEHINGVRDDNRIENLTILCPNCHAQTPTYRGKNIKKYEDRY